MINYKDMPKGTLHINLIQIFSTVSYAVLMGTLMFYLNAYSDMSRTEVNTLTASFFAINFLYHFLGGTLGGRYLSFRALFLISILLQVIGLSLLAIPTKMIILFGMATFITGAGLNVSCINMMLTQLFSATDKRRRIAFSINYSCMNMGFVLGFIVAGYLQRNNLYSAAFYFAAACLAIAFLFHIFAWRHLTDKKTHFASSFHKSPARFFIAPAIIIACFALALFLMYHPNIGSDLIYVVFFAVLITMIVFALGQETEYRIRIFAYLILTSACMIFACVQGMQSTALETFVEYNTSKSLFGIPMPAATVNMFESLGVIVFGFVLAMAMQKRQRHSTPYTPGYLVTKGLALYILAFLMIPLGIFLAGGGTVGVIFPILLLLVVSYGEIHVNAVNYAMAGEMMKPEHQGLFTGYLFMNVAVGINLAGPISNYALGDNANAETLSAAQTNPMYMHIFLIMAAIATVIAFIFFLLTRMINRMLDPNKEKQLEIEKSLVSELS
ncbi:MAG: MFS transporter [Francisellaceae bacterium]